MFDSRQTTSTTVKKVVKNTLKCRYCKTEMLQIDGGAFSSFVCANCGGRCILHGTEIETRMTNSMGFIVRVIKNIEWDKIPIKVKKCNG